MLVTHAGKWRHPEEVYGNPHFHSWHTLPGMMSQQGRSYFQPWPHKHVAASGLITGQVKTAGAEYHF